MGVEQISAVAQDYLKVIWSATEWGGAPITTKGLAARFGTTQASVSDTVRRLAAQGLVEYEPYRPVRLTAQGTVHALAMVRRHRLLETFLVTSLGYDWGEVHDDAERLEHAASDLLVERVDALLGQPRHDPHGDPIPAADGSLPPLPPVERLSLAPAGRYRVVRVSDEDASRLGRLASVLVAPGAELEVVASGAVELVVPGAGAAGAPVLVDPDDAAAVLVRRTR
ncbi:metal-dependent transcriptional regulator [Cellulomonas citrea]|uniref:metal-dependent transcriptional regulator n=1 Tax=Cellulomonas citrea TaxID=1909423 RepID=UPI001359D81B|nr:metal-dependent transcriptional regulator [Cellulomonas citrea]